MGNAFTTRSSWTRIGALAAGLALCAPLTATAQIEEITVTARKREESLQNVPIAISALTAGQVERQGLTSLADISRTAPSLVFTQGFSPQDKVVTIRGLAARRGRVNTAILLDGVDITSESIETVGGSLLIDPELFDLERVEIVKGPQNALYGRSAFNGAISYITRKPGDEFDARAGTDIGSDGQLKASVRLDGPLAPGLAGGVSIMTHSHDGFHRNSITGNQVGGREGYALAGTLVWQPASGIEVTARLSHSDDEYEVAPWALVNTNTQYAIPAAAIGGGGLPVSPGFPTAGLDGDVASLLGIPGLLPLTPGFVPGISGTYPAGDRLRATMSEDPRTCSDPMNAATCSDFPGTTREVTRATLNVDWDLGGVALTSLSHFATSDVFQSHDANALGSAFSLPLLTESRFSTDNDLFSQELRLSSRGDGPVSWTVGALYWKEKIRQVSENRTCLTVLHPAAPNPDGLPPFIPPLGLFPCGPFMANIGPQGQFESFPNRWARDTDHWSTYFLVEWQVLDTLSIAAEGRYVNERLEVSGPDGDTVIDPLGLQYNTDTTGCVGLPGVPGSCLNSRHTGINSGTDRDNFLVPKGTLRWNPMDNQMYYFSVAMAKKASGISALNGGIGAFVPDANRFDEEERMVYELGAKTTWLANRVQVNGALFFDDYDKKQISTQVTDPTTGLLTTRTVNGGKAEVLGLELEVSWQATDHLLLNAGYTWLDAEWTDFRQVTRSVSQIAYGGNCTPTEPDGNGRRGCIIDYSGNRLENAPEHTFVGSASYRRPLVGATDWLVEADARYQSERYPDSDNRQELDKFWIANLRAGISNERWDVVAYIDNVLDDDTIQSALSQIDLRYVAFDFGTNGVMIPNAARVLLPDPRTYGLRMSYRFGR